MRRETAEALSLAFNTIEGFLEAQHSLTGEAVMHRNAAVQACGLARAALDGEATAVPKSRRVKSPAAATDGSGAGDPSSEDPAGPSPIVQPSPLGDGASSSTVDPTGSGPALPVSPQTAPPDAPAPQPAQPE